MIMTVGSFVSVVPMTHFMTFGMSQLFCAVIYSVLLIHVDLSYMRK